MDSIQFTKDTRLRPVYAAPCVSPVVTVVRAFRMGVSPKDRTAVDPDTGCYRFMTHQCMNSGLNCARIVAVNASGNEDAFRKAVADTFVGGFPPLSFASIAGRLFRVFVDIDLPRHVYEASVRGRGVVETGSTGGSTITDAELTRMAHTAQRSVRKFYSNADGTLRTTYTSRDQWSGKVMVGRHALDAKKFKVCVDVVREDPEEKIGVHLVFPELVVDRERFEYITYQLADDFKRAYGDIGLIDTGVCGTAPKLRMPTCDKRGGKCPDPDCRAASGVDTNGGGPDVMVYSEPREVLEPHMRKASLQRARFPSTCGDPRCVAGYRMAGRVYKPALVLGGARGQLLRNCLSKLQRMPLYHIETCDIRVSDLRATPGWSTFATMTACRPAPETEEELAARTGDQGNVAPAVRMGFSRIIRDNHGAVKLNRNTDYAKWSAVIGAINSVRKPEWSIPARMQVVTMYHNERIGSYTVRMKGEGSHHCVNARNKHTSESMVYFVLEARCVKQRCFSKHEPDAIHRRVSGWACNSWAGKAYGMPEQFRKVLFPVPGEIVPNTSFGADMSVRAHALIKRLPRHVMEKAKHLGAHAS